MTPYYKKCHTMTVPSKEFSHDIGLDYIDEKVQGKSGPIQASFTSAAEHPLGKAWVDTFRTLGYGATGDPFSGQLTGGFTNPVSIDPKSKTRSYSAVAYYLPAKDRTNLHLLTGALVEKIVLEKTGGNITATGVKFTMEGKAHSVKARKDVILAAGVFNSPKLLELSGIGKKDLLESYGIEVIVDNAFVGENLQDHLMSGISYEVKDGVSTLDDLSRQNPEALQAAMTAYGTNQSGPFSAGSVNSFAFMPVVDFQVQDILEKLLESHPADTASTAHPAEQLHYDFVRSVISSPDEGSAAYYMYPVQANYTGTEAAKNFVVPLLPGNYITLGVVLLHPLSRGSTHISCPSAAAKPTIDARYLSHPLDVEVFARHLRYLETLAATEPLASFLKPGGRRNSPSAYIGRDGDLDAAKEYVRQTALSNWHAVGTCGMMSREKGGVVDERLLVHGTANLRIVDASIMPIITRGNPQASVYAVAERAADIIKEDHRLR